MKFALVFFFLLASPAVFALEGGQRQQRNGERRLKVPLSTREEFHSRLASEGYGLDPITGELVKLKDQNRRTRNLKRDEDKKKKDEEEEEEEDKHEPETKEPTKPPETKPPETKAPTPYPTPEPTAEPTKHKPKLIIKKPIEPECKLLTVLAKVEDILVGEQSNAVGEVNYFPVFDPFTYHPIGLYVEKVIIIHDDDDFCTYTGSFNFDFEPLNDEYFSEITIASSCMAHFATITGGNGQFSCASGWQNFIERFEANFVESNLFICYAPCTPHDPELIGGII